jgi:hypothetical protein
MGAGALTPSHSPARVERRCDGSPSPEEDVPVAAELRRGVMAGTVGNATPQQCVSIVERDDCGARYDDFGAFARETRVGARGSKTLPAPDPIVVESSAVFRRPDGWLLIKRFCAMLSNRRTIPARQPDVLRVWRSRSSCPCLQPVQSRRRPEAFCLNKKIKFSKKPKAGTFLVADEKHEYCGAAKP